MINHIFYPIVNHIRSQPPMIGFPGPWLAHLPGSPVLSHHAEAPPSDLLSEQLRQRYALVGVAASGLCYGS